MSDDLIAAVADRPVGDADYLALSRIVIDHAWLTDHGRADEVHELYVEEGELFLTPDVVLRGRSAIRDWGRQLVAAPPWRLIKHICGSMRFTAIGADAAEGYTSMAVYMTAGDDAATTMPWSVGEDHDRFVRTGQGWRLVSRRWTEHFARGDTIDVG